MNQDTMNYAVPIVGAIVVWIWIFVMIAAVGA